MKTLYYVTKKVSVMVVSDKKGFSFEHEVDLYLQTEARNRVPNRITIAEITSVAEIPEDWRGDVTIYGTETEMSATDYLKIVAKEKDPDYKEYVRLVKKFDGIDVDEKIESKKSKYTLK